MAKKRILIIEDEYDLAIMIEKYLLNEHYEVTIVNNGGIAFTQFEALRPDLLLLDLMLPEKNGLEILRQIRATSMIPVIIISAKETEFDRILGLKLGADDYLSKPFSMKELVARVEAIFRRIYSYQNKAEKATTISYHHFFINLTSREVFKKQEVVDLTAKEFNLLTFLAEHPRQVFSKEQIYEQVWGMDGYGAINTVTIHVQKIREKLGANHGIFTVRGIGYRFDGEQT